MSCARAIKSQLWTESKWIPNSNSVFSTTWRINQTKSKCKPLFQRERTFSRISLSSNFHIEPISKMDSNSFFSFQRPIWCSYWDETKKSEVRWVANPEGIRHWKMTKKRASNMKNHFSVSMLAMVFSFILC